MKVNAEHSQATWTRAFIEHMDTSKSANALLWWSLPGANRGARIKVTKLHRQRPSQQSSEGKPVKPLGTLPRRALLFGGTSSRSPATE